MPFGQLFDAVNRLPSPWNAVALWLIALVIAIVLFFKTVKIIPQDQRAMKLRRGRVVLKGGKVAEYESGIRLQIPFIDHYVCVSIRDRTYTLGTTNVTYGTYDFAEVDATVVLIPSNIYLIHFKNDELERRTVSLCQGLLRSVLHTHRQELLSGTSDIRGSIREGFAKLSEEPLAELGFAAPLVEVTDVRPYGQALIAKAIAEGKTPRPTD